MIKLKDEETKNEVVIFLNEMRRKQQECYDTQDVYYTKLSLYTALKKNILFSNLLLHPKVLFIEPFYKHKRVVEDNELEDLLREVIEFELTNDESFLTIDERNKIIKAHKALAKKREKNGNT